MVRLPPVADGEKPAATATDGERPAVLVTDECRQQVSGLLVATDEVRPLIPKAGDVRLVASVTDRNWPMMRLLPMADGLKPATMATDGERPAVTSEERLRLRASDGSQPQSRMEMTDGERPAATATDGEVSESQGFHPRVYSTHRLLSHPLTVPVTKVGGSLLQQSRNYAITQVPVYPHLKHETAYATLKLKLLVYPHLKHAIMTDGSLLQ
jgi:hypothetical protein